MPWVCSNRAPLARAYSEATIGLVLSLTNPSLIPQEMLACGLPCVDVASESMLATYGASGPGDARRARADRAV